MTDPTPTAPGWRCLTAADLDALVETYGRLPLTLDGRPGVLVRFVRDAQDRVIAIDLSHCFSEPTHATA